MFNLMWSTCRPKFAEVDCTT